MPTAQRAACVVLVLAAIVVGIVDASIYAVALTSLGARTSAAGFDSLAGANHLAAVVAILAALAVIVGTFGSERLAVPALTLFLMSGISALIAGGLFGVGRALFRLSNQTVLDTAGGSVAGSPELQLNSLISGVMGSGYDLAAVPIVLAIAAAVVPVIAVARRAAVRFGASSAAEATA